MNGTEAKTKNETPRLSKRLFRFAVVGGSGVVINQGLLMLLHGSFDWPLFFASMTAVEISILNNFLWNSLWTWKYDFGGSLRHWAAKCLNYHVATGISALVGNVLVLMILTKGFDMDYRLANLIGITVGALANYLLSELWVFRRQ